VQSLTVRVEAVAGVLAEEYEMIGVRVAQRLLEALEGVHVTMEVLKAGTLPKTEYKGCRVRDNRIV